MDQEIKELKALFIVRLGQDYTIAECEKFAKIAIEGGYKFKKCFNIDHEPARRTL